MTLTPSLTMVGQSQFLPLPGGTGVNVVAGTSGDHAFPIAALDAEAEILAPNGATTTTAKVRFAIIFLN